jgi:hypothetical protein
VQPSQHAPDLDRANVVQQDVDAHGQSGYTDDKQGRQFLRRLRARGLRNARCLGARCASAAARSKMAAVSSQMTAVPARRLRSVAGSEELPIAND